MALSANTAWEVRPTNGVDTNGGGFVAGATGTDWSQQNAAQYAVADAVTNGTTTITSATAAFGTDVVGNILYIAGGTAPITAGWYQIISRTSATAIVVDRSTGLTAGTGATLNIGGAMKTIPVAIAVMVRSNKVFVKAEATIVTTANILLNATGGVPSAANPPNRLIGYTSSRTDGGRVTIQLSTNSGLTALVASTAGWIIENFLIDCNSLTTSSGIIVSGATNSEIKNCLVKNFKDRGIGCGIYSVILDCEVTLGIAGATAGINAGAEFGSYIANCYIHDNACPGISNVSADNVCFCLITNNSGATSDGIAVTSALGIGSSLLLNNTIYGNGRHGLNVSVATGSLPMFVRNNMLVNNGGYGIQLASAAGLPALAIFDGNAYFNNTSGTRNNMDDTTTNPINGVSPYTNTLDVILTADPFTNAAGGDFTLNNTAGGGAAARSAGTPKLFVGVSDTPGHIDMGVFQHADPPVAVINQVINRYSYEGDY